MNGALMSFLSNWLAAGDAKKEKQDDRKYRESVIQKDWEHDASVRDESRKYKSTEESRLDLKGQKEQALNEAVAANRFDVAARPVYNAFPDTTPEYWQRLTNGNPAQLDSAVKAHQELIDRVPMLRSQNEAVGLQNSLTSRKAYGSNPAELEQLGNLERTNAIQLGNTGLAANKLKETEDVARLPLAGQVATSGQRETLVKNMLGGQPPSQAFLDPKQSSYTTVGEDGKITVRENPYFNRINKDPLANMAGGNNILKGAAEQLGFEKYPMEFTADGVPIQHKRPVTATPASSATPTIGGTFGVTTAAPVRPVAVLPKAYEAYREYLTPVQRTPEQDAEVEASRKSIFTKMREEYENNRRAYSNQKLMMP